MDREAIDAVNGAQANHHARIVRRQVAPAPGDETRPALIAFLDDHLGTHEIASLLAYESHAEPVIVLDLGDVAQDRDGIVHVADDEIEPAIIVEVAERHAAAEMLVVKVRPGALARVSKPPLDITQYDGRLLHAHALTRVTDDVAIGDDDVEPAMVIEVHEGIAEADVFLPHSGDAGGRGAVIEQFIAKVAI